MNSIRVVVADDHAMVRGAIREILEKVQDIQVVAERAVETKRSSR
ncbi:MAG TPA: hypothetical protein VIK64_09760 [Anaerolineales bacterium]